MYRIEVSAHRNDAFFYLNIFNLKPVNNSQLDQLSVVVVFNVSGEGVARVATSDWTIGR